MWIDQQPKNLMLQIHKGAEALKIAVKCAPEHGPFDLNTYMNWSKQICTLGKILIILNFQRIIIFISDGWYWFIIESLLTE